jgi:hypothetical protein
LLKSGADPNAKTTAGATPLLLSVQKGNLQFAKFLLDNGASVSGLNEENGENVSLPPIAFLLVVTWKILKILPLVLSNWFFRPKFGLFFHRKTNSTGREFILLVLSL